MRGPLTSLTRILSLSLPAVRLPPRRSRAQFGRRRRVAAPEVISPSPSCPAVSLATDAVSSLLSVEGLWVSHRLQTRLAGTLGPLAGYRGYGLCLCADRQTGRLGDWEWRDAWAGRGDATGRREGCNSGLQTLPRGRGTDGPCADARTDRWTRVWGTGMRDGRRTLNKGVNMQMCTWLIIVSESGASLTMQMRAGLS